MKTEDLKNYIFEQLNETSPERATALARARDDEGLKASEAGYLAAKHSVKIQKNPKNLDQRKIDAMNSATVQLMDLASEKFSKARKARNRSLGRRGDGSPRTPKQESALNFINSLKRLNETSRERATALAIARGDEGLDAEQASRFAANHFNKIKKQSWINRFPAHPDEIKAIAMARDEFTNLAYEKYRKSSRAWNRVNGRRGDGSPRTPN